MILSKQLFVQPSRGTSHIAHTISDNPHPSSPSLTENVFKIILQLRLESFFHHVARLDSTLSKTRPQATHSFTTTSPARIKNIFNTATLFLQCCALKIRPHQDLPPRITLCYTASPNIHCIHVCHAIWFKLPPAMPRPSFSPFMPRYAFVSAHAPRKEPSGQQ